METTVEKKPPIWPVVTRLVKMSGPRQGWLAGAILIDLVQAAVLVLSNHWMRQIFDSAMARNVDRFWYFFWLSLVVSLALFPFSYLKTYGIGRFSEGLLALIRTRVAGKSARLPVSYMETRHSGDMLSVLNADLGKLKNLFQSNLIDLIGQSVRLVAAFGYILSVNWVLALVSTIVTPALFIGVSALTAPVSKRGEQIQEDIGLVNSVAKDSISGAMVIKAFNLVEMLDRRFRQANQQVLDKGRQIAWLRAIIDAVGFGLAITPFIIAMGLGGYMVIEGRMTFGAMFAFINLLNYVVNPLGSLPGVIASISEAAGAGRRVLDLVDQPSEPEGGQVTSPASRSSAVSFDRVTFGYNCGQPVLKEVSLQIPAGQTVAIVGPSGGGKSTLLKLILGYYPLKGGRLEILGHDLEQWSRTALRDQMAFVAQETYLFPVSIAENIRLGRPGASDADVRTAARMANIDDFIASLPQGYETNAGEWGGRLSGGQRQRIALARAVLKDAPILLLDEPTSALDTESEALVQQALERFTQGRTTVVVAHRLSTIKNADLVVVLQDGHIVDQGTHTELLERGGLYLELYQRQFQLDQPASKSNGGALSFGSAQPAGAGD